MAKSCGRAVEARPRHGRRCVPRARTGEACHSPDRTGPLVRSSSPAWDVAPMRRSAYSTIDELVAGVRQARRIIPGAARREPRGERRAAVVFRHVQARRAPAAAGARFRRAGAFRLDSQLRQGLLQPDLRRDDSHRGSRSHPIWRRRWSPSGCASFALLNGVSRKDGPLGIEWPVASRPGDRGSPGQARTSTR